MEKIFGFFTKKMRKEDTFDNISVEPFSTQVYKHYEFDSGIAVDECANALRFDLKDTPLHLKASGAQKISLGKADKSRKSMFVINIKNCRNFHVGPKEIINVTRNGDYIEEGLLLPVNFNLLLDCQEKISDECIMVISRYLGSNWKIFGESLGFKENYLEELKCRNDDNTIFLTFDILQKYVSLFPNTSIGFLVDILNEIREIKIISEIAKAKNCM